MPDDAPVEFVPRSWRPHVHRPDGGIDRHHWEQCLLSELRSALRAGEIWVQGSRRYTNPERFVIARSDWPSARPQILRDLELPQVRATTRRGTAGADRGSARAAGSRPAGWGR